MKIGIYIHIPFCKQRCKYCDFVSYVGEKDLQNRYVQALKKEIKNWREKNLDTEISTVYIGGGTPSCIESKNIIEILNQINLNEEINKQGLSQNWKSIKTEPSPNCPIVTWTIEVNPGTVSEQKLVDYRNAGINRLSIGLQSTNNKILKEIGRIHTYQDFLETYKLARKVGFEDINVDLMIGLPNQKMQDVKNALEDLINLEPSAPEHISVYSLIVEENTPLQKLIDENKLSLPSEELERNMYWYVKNFLEANGYKHYEISNFAKPGFESKHNMDCWDQQEYRGFGAAAHSYIKNQRFHNTECLDDYIKNIEKGIYEKNIIIDEIQDKLSKMNEFILIGLRKIDGISIKEFKCKFNEDPIILFEEKFGKLKEEKLITINGDRIKLTNRGLDLANLVWEEFV